MSATLMDGRAVSAAVRDKLALRVRELEARGVKPHLAVVLVGEDPASQIYVRNKERACEKLGIRSTVLRLAAECTQQELEDAVRTLSADPQVHGILVQLPLPRHIDPAAVIEAIPPEKDVDGFTPVNAGRLLNGEPCFAPCTPAGCLRMIEAAGVDLDGKHAVVVGRSNIVGKPAALLLMQKNATVTVCHSHTRDLAAVCRTADVLIAAVGKAGFITADMVKPGAVVIDVGINRGADGKLHGDVDFAPVSEVASCITPVPGGVGLMTRAMLMLNTVQAAAPKTAGDLGFSVKNPVRF